MASLKRTEYRIIDQAFGMGGGYVLDFSNRTLSDWFEDEFNIDIYADSYASRGDSKANRVRSFVDVEPAPLVARMLRALWKYRERMADYNAGTEARDKEQLFEVIAKLEDPALRLDDIKAHALRFDAAHIADQIRRMEGSIVKDPALAIGTAKELVESCFKTILRERGIDYDKEDLPQLGKKVFGALRLLPNDIPEAARGAKTIKTMLSNLATVVQGVAEIRSLYGTGHGRDGKVRGVTPRHARLAVGAASTLVNFAFESHLESPASESHVHITS
ncbi:abortive infection family protein [Sphingobium yanoikuyae]|jgi:Abortive infection C-terminus|uniref:abortive infection family protein n=1 Tax=Sphingobium yanoikuyae TaxID=13690 RepID=UPI002FDE51E7